MWLLIIFGGIFLLLWFLHDKRRCSKYPPGPLRFPFIGNILQLARLSPHPGKAFYELSKKYGDVCYLRLGLTDILVLNSLKSINEIKGHKFAMERAVKMVPTINARNTGKNNGIIFALHGEDNNPMRRYTIRTLRDFGFGKRSSMDQAISFELEEFIKKAKENIIVSSSGEAVVSNAVSFFMLSTSKTVMRYVLGSDSCNSGIETDQRMQKLLKLSHEVIKSFNIGMSVAIAFPFLYSIFPFWLGKKEQIESYGKLKDYLREFVNEQRKNGTSKNYRVDPQDYLEHFLGKIEEEKGNPETIFSDEQLNMCLLDLFQSGGETTSTTLSFMILYMLAFENIQEKVQTEIDQNVFCGGEGAIITLSMKDKLPYTYATMLECFRFSSLMPTGILHDLVSQDFYYKGFLIKKGINIIPNFYGVHFCEKTWGDADNFRPDRFLNDDGTLNVVLSNNLIAFGCGARICLGMAVGENIVFSYFATLLKNFKFVKASASDELCVEPVLGCAQHPKPYRFKMLQRV